MGKKTPRTREGKSKHNSRASAERNRRGNAPIHENDPAATAQSRRLKSSAIKESTPSSIGETQRLAQEAKDYLETHQEQTIGAATSVSSGDVDDGLFAVMHDPAYSCPALIRTTEGDDQDMIVAIQSPVLIRMSVPPVPELIERVLTALKEEGLPSSTRYAARVLLTLLVSLHEKGTRFAPGLFRDKVAFYCGMLWEQMQNSKAQRYALGGKSIAKGRKKSIETRANAKFRRIEQFRSERNRCAKEGYKFSKRDACRVIAMQEIEHEERVGAPIENAKREIRIESRAKAIEKQLRKYFPGDFK